MSVCSYKRRGKVIPKIKYDTIHEARVAAYEVTVKFDTIFNAYKCTHCAYYHVGRQSNYHDWNMQKLELGIRAAACIRKENSGTKSQRFRALVQRMRKLL